MYGRWTPNKYGNRKTEVDGILFDSAKEARRYGELDLMLKAGDIRDLRLQVSYELIPAQKDKRGKAVRPVSYVADFVYFTRDGGLVVEDAKGMRTDVYKIKKKLMLWIHGIEIKEV